MKRIRAEGWEAFSLPYTDTYTSTFTSPFTFASTSAHLPCVSLRGYTSQWTSAPAHDSPVSALPCAFRRKSAVMELSSRDPRIRLTPK